MLVPHCPDASETSDVDRADVRTLVDTLKVELGAELARNVRGGQPLELVVLERSPEGLEKCTQKSLDR
eukprot:15446046-Alexandrium_andersonii.AAC.1